LETVELMSQVEIERLVTRGGKFLRAAGTRPAIMRELLALGYSVKEHQNGWNLFLDLCGYNPTIVNDGLGHGEVQAAIDELDNWDGPAFARAHAALAHHYPDQEAYLFDGLQAQTGMAAVATCKELLDRARTLRDGKDPARAHCREADAAAEAPRGAAHHRSRHREAHVRPDQDRHATRRHQRSG
jgi:hypothetical protein